MGALDILYCLGNKCKKLIYISVQFPQNSFLPLLAECKDAESWVLYLK